MPHTLLQQIKRWVQESLWFIEENKDWQSLGYSLKSAAELSHSQWKGSQNVYRNKFWMLILFFELVMVLKQEPSNPAQIAWGKWTKGHNSEPEKNKAISSAPNLRYYMSSLIGKKG